MRIIEIQIQQFFLLCLSISFFMIITVDTIIKTPHLVNSESLTIDTEMISGIEELKTGLQELTDYEYYRNQITSTYFQNIKNHIENFSNFGSRVTGYPGYEHAINYIKDFFISQNLINVQTLSYPLLMSIDHNTKITIKGENYTAHALVSNSVHTCKTSSTGLLGTLIYGGSGEFSDLDGKEIEESVVILEFDSQDNWINVASLGAKAVIYLKPNDTNRFEAETKSIDIPLEFPRIYIHNRTTAETIRELSYQLNQSITIYSDVEWESINAKNIMGILPGLDDDIIIISAHFDSSSFVPAVSPGADEACGIATLLETIRIMKDNDIVPKKTIMFLALSGHNQAASGAREFVFQNYERLNIKGGIKLFLSLDLSASTNKIGINPYGYLYKFKLKYTTGNNLYKRLKSIGEDLFLQYASDIELVDNHSFEVESYINMLDRFENIAPITFVGDQEPFIASNVLGLSLYSAGSPRLRFNTPFDLPIYLQLEKLKSQVIYSICALVQLVNDDNLEHYLDLRQEEFSVKHTTHVGYGIIKGSCKEYNETTSWVNNVANAIIRVKSRDPNTGKFGIYSYYTNTDENGSFQVRGVSSSQPDNPFEFEVEAYAFDSEGKLVKTNNLGPYGVFFEQSKKLITKEITINPTVFNCGTLSLFEISHPFHQDISDQTLTYQVLDPETRISLSFYGYKNIESVSLIFLPPNTRASIIGTFTDKIVGVYATNSSPKILRGSGFQVYKGEFKNLGIATFITSKDLKSKTQTYLNWYMSQNIYDEEVSKTFQRVSGQINYANQLKENYQYSKAIIEIENARILADTALKQAQNVIEDGNMTALLFAVFLIPFSIALTILLFDINTGVKFTIVSSAIYSVTFGYFYLIHPGFKIAPHLGITLIGIINLISVFIIFYMFVWEMNDFLKSLRAKTLGSHYTEIGRMSAMLLAIKTGINRMKKQKFRTSITLSGMALLTFSLTLFASTSTQVGNNILELAIPIAIAIFLMMNSAISIVYDSKREISIFTSIGLSPTHIIGLFLAEFLVHAIIGSVIGYSGGITIIRILSTAGWIPETFSINYSSRVVFIALAFSGLGLLVSILYPLRIASRISVPSQKRTWEITTLPEDEGTKWNISLPFVVSNEKEAEGIIAFLREYFLIYESESVGGAFFLRQISLKNNQGIEKSLMATVNLAPFDMGIIQTIDIHTYYDKENDHWKFTIRLARLEGVLQAWQASIKQFVGKIRQQLLLWKVLSQEEKTINIERFRREFDSDDNSPY